MVVVTGWVVVEVGNEKTSPAAGLKSVWTVVTDVEAIVVVVVVVAASASTSGSVDGSPADSALAEQAAATMQRHATFLTKLNFTLNLSAGTLCGQAAIVDLRSSGCHADQLELFCGCSSMVERNLPKVDTRVRFPSSARVGQVRQEGNLPADKHLRWDTDV